ncbi:MAG: diguanylate cyclase, partial [Myxococcota bacterium]
MTGPVPFGRFWLHERIGRGGMADVYRATVGEDPYRFSLEFALKRMHDALLDDSAFVDMFLIEEYVQGLLHHPNIIRMFESGRHQDRVPYIAMEYVRGSDLDTVLTRVMERKLRVPLDVAIMIALEVLKALDYAHRAISTNGRSLELIHRDVTPANIYLAYDGKVKLGDFGVARVRNLEPPEHAGMLKGKVAYVPPDVLLGGEPSQRDDLWALSVSFYEMLSGASYFANASEDEIMRRVGAARLPRIDLGAHHTKELKALVQRLLHPKPHKRPQTAAELYKLLKAFAARQGMHLAKENIGRFVLSLFGDVGVMAGAQGQPIRDPLTGAMSGHYAHEHLSREIDRARRYRRELSLVTFNVDQFSRVNRRTGTATGDDLLGTIVRQFLPNAMKLRSSDVVARRRGDHFTVILPETPARGAEKVAERLCRRFRRFAWREHVPGLATVNSPLTVSVSVVAFREHGQDASELLQAADAAVSMAKRNGGNRVTPLEEAEDIHVAAPVTTQERWLAWEMPSNGDTPRKTVE